MVYSQAKLLVPLWVERGRLHRGGPDEFGRQSGVQTVSLLASRQIAAVARSAVAVAQAAAQAVVGQQRTGAVAAVAEARTVAVVAPAVTRPARHRLLPLETEPEARMLLETLYGHYVDERVATLSRRGRRRRRMKLLVGARVQRRWRRRAVGTAAGQDSQHAVGIAESCWVEQEENKNINMMFLLSHLHVA